MAIMVGLPQQAGRHDTRAEAENLHPDPRVAGREGETGPLAWDIFRNLNVHTQGNTSSIKAIPTLTRPSLLILLKQFHLLGTKR